MLMSYLLLRPFSCNHSQVAYSCILAAVCFYVACASLTLYVKPHRCDTSEKALVETPRSKRPLNASASSFEYAVGLMARMVTIQPIRQISSHLLGCELIWRSPCEERARAVSIVAERYGAAAMRCEPLHPPGDGLPSNRLMADWLKSFNIRDAAVAPYVSRGKRVSAVPCPPECAQKHTVHLVCLFSSKQPAWRTSTRCEAVSQLPSEGLPWRGMQTVAGSDICIYIYAS